MAEEAKKRFKDGLKYDFHQLLGAQVAGEYLSQGGEQGVVFAKKSLESVLKSIKRYEPYVESILTDPKNLEATINGQLDTYNKCKSEETVGELIDYDSKTFEGYSVGGTQRVKDEFSELLKLTYADLMYKQELANYVAKGEKFGKSTAEEVEKAKEEVKMYQKLITTISLGENERLSKIRTAGEKDMAKQTFNQMYPEKKDEK
jgi:hypothetical protein